MLAEHHSTSLKSLYHIWKVAQPSLAFLSLQLPQNDTIDNVTNDGCRVSTPSVSVAQGWVVITTVGWKVIGD